MSTCSFRRCRLPALIACGVFLLIVVLAAVSGHAQNLPDEKRVAELAAMLPKSPAGVGRPLADRKAWEAVARSDEFKEVVREAESLLKKPMPEASDEVFLEFSQNGNRTRYQGIRKRRHSRLRVFTQAECLENRGRFLPAIEEVIRELATEKTWLYPAHDRDLANFKGTRIDIDLGSAATSWTMATADYWLGDKLSPKTRKLVRDELERRTLRPFESYARTGTPRLWWATGTNNWNAVCLAGVTGTALAIIDDPKRRAFFVAASEKYVQRFLAGFTADGYCSEGVGYWNYGFGHYVLLSETIYQATDGQLDLMEAPKVAEIARFGVRMEIVPGLFPAFADCHVGSAPEPRLMAFLSRRFGLGLGRLERENLLAASGPPTWLFALGLHGFPNSATNGPVHDREEHVQPLRNWFADAGILICRPAHAQPALGVALKGGHNAEHHNHNDVGSFLVTLGRDAPLVDPGSEVYTARTFSGKRYDSGVLNSFGHPVPLVAGEMQKKGRKARAEVVRTEFTDTCDTIVLDLRKAYAVSGLKKLERTFVFSRQGRGSLTVTDRIECDKPQTFGTALVTFAAPRESFEPSGTSGPKRLIVGRSGGSVVVEIETAGQPWQLDVDQIEEDLPEKKIPSRLGINLIEPVTSATVTLTITPHSAETGK